jgi:photosystem II stability/assembly factor-like uncharacterized protein
MKKLLILCALLPCLVSAQEDKKTPPPTRPLPPSSTKPPAVEPWADVLDSLTPRELGPVNVGGRVTDLAVYEKEPRIFYVASASGGLYKTINAGTTFNPVFDHEKTISLGACAVAQTNPDIVWVGTGEATSRNSVAWGDGVYKSTDGGKTWTNMGLGDTLQIGKIVIDPIDPNTVWVAAAGLVWGPSNRGLFKTTDGGKTWRRVLYVDDSTGAIDLKMDPKNNHVLLCAMYQRLRKPWDFISGGPGSGLYKSMDGGDHWRKLNKGIPSGPLGRIGMSYYAHDPHEVVATIEYKPDPKEKRPKNSEEVPRYAGGTFRSMDGGESWKQINPLNPRPFYFSLPYVDPNDDKRIYVMGDSPNLSIDGGVKFKELEGRVHPDFHAMWVDPKDSNNVLVGNDGGVYFSHDKCLTWDHLNGMPIGQFYAVATDNRRPYWIYGGLQDNSCWGVPTQTSRGGVSFFDSVSLGGGDGFHVAVDPDDWATVYSESQSGSAGRVDLRTGQGRSIRPSLKGQKLRFNWSTPFIISPHNARTLYFGANFLFKSTDRGDHWKPISPDLTTNNPKTLGPSKESVSPEDSGAETHCTIITISESPLKEGLLYVGSDDGQVQVTQDDGVTWSNVTKNIPDLPTNTWCSRVLASKWAEGRAYATFDGHRTGDFKPYVYETDDYGKIWKKLNEGLPDYDCLYVILEGQKNSSLLFLGSEMSLRASLDGGQTWGRVRNKFPTVAVHDVVEQPKELDLVIGTHGRSIWTLDVTALEGLTSDALKQDVAIFKPQDVLILGRINSGVWDGDRVYAARNTQPGTRIEYRLAKIAKTVKLTVSTPDGSDSLDLDTSNHAGLNVVNWNGRLFGRPVAGDYRVTLTVDGKDYLTSAHVVEALLSGN